MYQDDHDGGRRGNRRRSPVHQDEQDGGRRGNRRRSPVYQDDQDGGRRGNRRRSPIAQDKSRERGDDYYDRGKERSGERGR